MQRVTIVDRISGCPLHDTIKLWKEDERNPSTPAKIVHLFTHIARSLKEDQVTRVVFEMSNDDVKKPKKRHNYNYNAHRYTTSGLNTPGQTNSRNSTGNPLMLAYRQPTLQSVRTRTMEMWCAMTEFVMVALFVAPDAFKEDPKICVQEIAQRFTDSYHSTLLELKPKFIELSHDTELARNDHSFLQFFTSFKLDLNEEVDFTCYRTQSPQPQQPTQPPQLLLSFDMPDDDYHNDLIVPTDSRDDAVLGEMLIEQLERGSQAVDNTEQDDKIIMDIIKRPSSPTNKHMAKPSEHSNHRSRPYSSGQHIKQPVGRTYNQTLPSPSSSLSSLSSPFPSQNSQSGGFNGNNSGDQRNHFPDSHSNKVRDRTSTVIMNESLGEGEKREGSVIEMRESVELKLAQMVVDDDEENWDDLDI